MEVGECLLVPFPLCRKSFRAAVLHFLSTGHLDGSHLWFLVRVPIEYYSFVSRCDSPTLRCKPDYFLCLNKICLGVKLQY